MTSTTYPIPKGWRRVVRGRTRKGDKAWYQSDRCRTGDWVDVANEWWVVGLPVDGYWCIIRRVKVGAA